MLLGGSDIMLQSAILYFSWVFTIILNKSGERGFFIGVLMI